MGLIKDQNVEDEYSRILDDMGFDLPDNIAIKEKVDYQDKKHQDEKDVNKEA